jgi:hypothetical protein
VRELPAKTCLGLHPVDAKCGECNPKHPLGASVANLGEAMVLIQRICQVYRDSITDHCGHDHAIERVVELCGVTRRFAVKTVAKRCQL